MNLRDLEYVVAVADEAHFGRASERCHVSQPALSGQIKKLEESLGVKLFERTNRRVALTPVGTEIVAQARELLRRADEIEQTAASHADPLAGRVRFGTIPTIGPYLLPSILRPLKAALPKAQVVLAEDVTQNLERRLRAGDIDVAVTATDPVETGIAEVALYDEPFLVAMPAGHPLEDTEAVDVRDIDARTLLLLRDGHCLSDQVAKLCGVSETPEPADLDTRAASLETVLGLVAAGVGITLLPASAADADGHVRAGVVLRPALNADAGRNVRLIFRETYPKRALVQEIARVIGDHPPNGVRPEPSAA